MITKFFPSIDSVATGENIARLRREKGYSVVDLQSWFGFEAPQAVYKWQRGESLPSVDNLYALSVLLGVSMNDIIVERQLNSENGQFKEDCPFGIVMVCYIYKIWNIIIKRKILLNAYKFILFFSEGR